MRRRCRPILITLSFPMASNCISYRVDGADMRRPINDHTQIEQATGRAGIAQAGMPCSEINVGLASLLSTASTALQGSMRGWRVAA